MDDWGHQCDDTAVLLTTFLTVVVQDDKDDGKDIGTLKQLMAHNWVEPTKRERKRVLNYSEADYYKQALKTTKAERSAGPRLPKMPQLADFQFYDVNRLTQLFEKENAYELHKHHLQQKEANARQQVGTCWLQ